MKHSRDVMLPAVRPAVNKVHVRARIGQSAAETRVLCATAARADGD